MNIIKILKKSKDKEIIKEIEEQKAALQNKIYRLEQYYDFLIQELGEEFYPTIDIEIYRKKYEKFEDDNYINIRPFCFSRGVYFFHKKNDEKILKVIKKLSDEISDCRKNLMDFLE